MATVLTNALLRRRDTISRRISPTTYRLPPVTRFSNRNCKELKTDVTRCKQRSVTSSNRNRQPGKAKGEKAKYPKFCDLAGFAFAPLTTCHWALSNRQIRQLEMGISRALSTKDAILIDRKGGGFVKRGMVAARGHKFIFLKLKKRFDYSRSRL